MAGARISIEMQGNAGERLSEMIAALDDPKPLLANIREYLIRAHMQRFTDQKSPDGTAWQALSPRYQRRKTENADKILTFRGYLKTTLRGVIDDDGMEFGTDRTDMRRATSQRPRPSRPTTSATRQSLQSVRPPPR